MSLKLVLNETRFSFWVKTIIIPNFIPKVSSDYCPSFTQNSSKYFYQVEHFYTLCSKAKLFYKAVVLLRLKILTLCQWVSQLHIKIPSQWRLKARVSEEILKWHSLNLKPSLSSQWSLVWSFCTRLLLHQFCMTLLSERGESNKTNANKV